jgi:acyl-CoA thioesterase FadM
VGEGEPHPPVTVAEYHLDTNHHVNNGQYVAMADHVVRSVDEGFELGLLEVQYKRAAQLGDVVVPHLYVEEDGYAVDLAATEGDSFAIVRLHHR